MTNRRCRFNLNFEVQINGRNKNHSFLGEWSLKFYKNSKQNSNKKISSSLDFPFRICCHCCLWFHTHAFTIQVSSIQMKFKYFNGLFFITIAYNNDDDHQHYLQKSSSLITNLYSYFPSSFFFDFSTIPICLEKKKDLIYPFKRGLFSFFFEIKVP